MPLDREIAARLRQFAASIFAREQILERVANGLLCRRYASKPADLDLFTRYERKAEQAPTTNIALASSTSAADRDMPHSRSNEQ
jgi:hypothetical protein